MPNTNVLLGTNAGFERQQSAQQVMYGLGTSDDGELHDAVIRSLTN